MTFRPFFTPRLRVLSFCAALAAGALGTLASPAALRSAPKNAEGIPAPSDTPVPTPPTVSLDAIYGFTALPFSTPQTNNDGARPSALIADGQGNFVGTANSGGTGGNGTVFKVMADGTFATLHDFPATDGNGANTDGALPDAPLVADGGGNFYGTTSSGGTFASGTIFKIDSTNTFSVLYTFGTQNSPLDASSVQAALVYDGAGNLYGTAAEGGANGSGAIFKITTGGTYTLIHSFAALTGESGYYPEGSSPGAALVPDGHGNFLGVARLSGVNHAGTIFEVTPDGTLTVLHNFDTPNEGGDNNDGANPASALVGDGSGTFYGVTPTGGGNGSGTIYKITTDGTLAGTNFTLLYVFSPPNANTGGQNVNLDGADPASPLIYGLDGNLYGTAQFGGLSGQGTLFQITPSGDFTTLYDFVGNIDSNNNDGGQPTGALLQTSTTDFYGVTSQIAATSFVVGPAHASGRPITQPRDTTSTGYGTVFHVSVIPAAGVFSFASVGSVNENAANAVVTVRRTGGSTGVATVNYATADFTAKAGTDYTAVNNTLTWTDGDTTDKTITVPITDRHLTSGSVIFLVNLTSPTGGAVLQGTSDTLLSVPVTITDNDVLPAPVITSDISAFGTAGTAFSYQITATNNPTSFNATNLPAGLSVNTATGLISGTPTAATVVNVGISATNATGTGTSAVQFVIATAPASPSPSPSPAPTITSAPTASGRVGTAFSYQITATNSPTTYVASGLPAGLSVNASTGLISGTPSATGTFTVSLSATNATATGTATLTLTITGAPVITSALTASVQTGTVFTYQIAATNNPTAFGASGLPTGLTVNTTTGLISGTPTAVNGYAITLFAANATGSGSAVLNLTVTAAPVTPPVITSAVSASAVVGVPFTYQITADNNPISFGTSALPTGLTVDIPTGLISGTPTVAGTFPIVLAAANAGGTANASLLLTITAPVFEAQPTVALVSPPNAITVFVGQDIPLAASVTDPDAVFASVTFLLDGQVVNTITNAAGPFVGTANLSTTGDHVLQAVVTDTLGRTNSNAVTVTAIPVDTANPPPTADLLTPLNGRDIAAGTLLTLSATADSTTAAGLDHASIVVDGTTIATFDANGVLITSSAGTGTPVRQAASTTSLSRLFTAQYQMPGLDKILTMIVTATDKLGHTSVSNVTSFHGKVTTDRAPAVNFTSFTNSLKVLVNSVNTSQIVGSDPDATTTNGVIHAGPVRQDASTDAVLASLEYWINGVNITKVDTTLKNTPLPVAFNPTVVGKYVLHAVATDGSGLATVSDPVVVQVDPLPPVVTVVISGDGMAVEGGEVGKVAIRRDGDLSAALTVRYKARGSAKAGTDYKAGPVTGTAIIPAGAAQVKVKIKPLDNQTVDGTRIAKIKLLPSLDGSYTLGTAIVAKIKVIDNDK